MSDSNRVKVYYVSETTAAYGSTPAGSGNWVETRMTGESLRGQPRTVVSNEIRSDRMIADLRKVGLDVNGALNHEWSYGTYDDFIQAVMGDTWTGNVLNVGTRSRSFSMEKDFEDVATAIAAFKGMRAGIWTESFTYGELVTGSFEFMGNNVSILVSSRISAYTTAGTAAVFDAADGISSIMVNGTEVTGCIFSSLTFTVDNTQRMIEGIGNASPCDIGQGRANITGSAEMFFKAGSKTYVSAMIKNEALDLQFTVSDGTNGYIIRWPRIKLADGFPVSDGPDTDVMLPFSFTATYDTSAGTSMRVTRF